MSTKKVQVGSVTCGNEGLFLISGPCVVEDESIMMQTAETLKKVSEKLNLPLIFKSSFMKDNRSKAGNYTGPGEEEGLAMLAKIKKEFNLPVTSDVHYPEHVKAAKDILDIIQIPAFLCMQGTLLNEAGRTGKPVNLKHGQFLAPENMGNAASKIEEVGNTQIILTERGYTFGYNDLIVDPRSFFEMRKTGYPVVFDVTHSIRKYGIPSSDPRGGARQYLPTIARAGVASGIDGLFIEAHPEPPKALCDAASQMWLKDMEEFLKPLIEIHHITRSEVNKYETV